MKRKALMLAFVTKSKEEEDVENLTKVKVCYYVPVTQEDGTPGKDKRITSENSWNKMLKDAAEKNVPPPELCSIGTFGYKYPETVAEFLELCNGNEQVAIDHAQYAVGLRQDNTANDILQENDYTQQEGARDVSFSIAEKRERAKMSNEEKSAKLLGISADDIKKALEMLRAAQAQAQLTT
jgi:hypothetical protein